MNDLKIIIAERIKCLREQNQLTQAQLARKLQVSRNCVNAWEMGISLPTIVPALLIVPFVALKFRLLNGKR